MRELESNFAGEESLRVTAVQERQDLYFARYATLEKQRSAREPSWLRNIRRAAIDRFGDLGYPTTRQEEWRFTNMAKPARTAFVPAQSPSGAAGENPARLLIGRSQPWVLGEAAGCHTLVFVNGYPEPALSSAAAALPAGVRAGSLAAAIGEGHPALETHLANHAGYRDHALVALNTALFEDGAFVEIRPNTVVKMPVALVFVTLPGAEPSMTHPHNLVLVGVGAQVSLIEAHLGPAGLPYLTNAVTEVAAGDNAIVDYTRVQDEGTDAYHIGVVQAEQKRSSSVTLHTIAQGAAIDREETRAVLDGEGAEALLHGLYVLGGVQHVDNHTLIDHAKPHCSSREVYKGVLDGASGGVFNGKIVVRKDAQKTDSKQSNKNLLLSEDAVINTKPQLEIYADDVKCTHGATIGQIDAEAIFYMRSRGIGLEEARRVLIQAFANDILDRIKFAPLRASLQQALAARLERTGVGKLGGMGGGGTSSLVEAG
jgi:Fe-S cluster assembly protein SufD